MIEINLLPGAHKKSRGLASGAALRDSLAKAATKVKDPYLVTTALCILIAAAAIGTLTLRQSTRAAALTSEEQMQIEDSTRFATVLREKRKAEAQRDSVTRQLAVIKSIDNDRFVWPHIMQEISRDLPAYTWIVSIDQTSAPTTASDVGPRDAQNPHARHGAPHAAATPAMPVPPAMQFRIVGNTVDIQALTQFMKQLEASPFVQNVQLEKSLLTTVDGKDVTEFTLDAESRVPDSTAIRTVPLTLSVR